MVEGTTKRRTVPPGRSPRGKPVLFVEVGARLLIVRLGRVPTVIGRGGAADIEIDNDGLSREHAKFVVAADGEVTVVDLESTNGTYIAGQRVELSAVAPNTVVQLGPDVRATLRYPDPDGGSVIERLTPRQLEIARLVAKGLTSAEIGDTLCVSPRTIDSHVDRIIKRIGCKGRAGLAQRVTAEGLAPSNE